MSYYRCTMKEGVKWSEAPLFKHINIHGVFEGNAGMVYFRSPLAYMPILELSTGLDLLQGVSAERYEDAKQLHDMRNAFPALYKPS